MVLLLRFPKRETEFLLLGPNEADASGGSGLVNGPIVQVSEHRETFPIISRLPIWKWDLWTATNGCDCNTLLGLQLDFQCQKLQHPR